MLSRGKTRTFVKCPVFPLRGQEVDCRLVFDTEDVARCQRRSGWVLAIMKACGVELSMQNGVYEKRFIVRCGIPIERYALRVRLTVRVGCDQQG